MLDWEWWRPGWPHCWWPSNKSSCELDCCSCCSVSDKIPCHRYLRFISAIFKAMAFLSPRVGALSEAVPQSFYRFKRHMVTFIPDFESFDKNVFHSTHVIHSTHVVNASLWKSAHSNLFQCALLKTIVSSSGKCRHYPYLFFSIISDAHIEFKLYARVWVNKESKTIWSMHI